MNDVRIIEELRKGNRSRGFQLLYKGYPVIEQLILSKGGNKEDAKDVFQNALIIFYEKAQQSNFQLTSKISTYLYSVARFLWKDELQKRKKFDQYDEDPSLDQKEEEEIKHLLIKEKRYDMLEHALLQIGEKCLKLLKLFYYEGLSMKLIAKKLDFNSENVAKTQKYKCIERAKLKVKELQSAKNQMG